MLTKRFDSSEKNNEKFVFTPKFTSASALLIACSALVGVTHCYTTSRELLAQQKIEKNAAEEKRIAIEKQAEAERQRIASLTPAQLAAENSKRQEDAAASNCKDLSILTPYTVKVTRADADNVAMVFFTENPSEADATKAVQTCIKILAAKNPGNNAFGMAWSPDNTELKLSNGTVEISYTAKDQKVNFLKEFPKMTWKKGYKPKSGT